MPTGYTAELMEKGITFRTFALQCARAFGACIAQRDDPMDALPQKQEPNDYNTKALKKARASLAKLKAMSAREAQEHGAALRKKTVDGAREYLAKSAAENERLRSMEREVSRWTPPTDDHKGLRDFMLEQIRISKNGDFAQKSLAAAIAKSAEEYFAEEVASASRDITYHTEECAKEAARTKSRNDWIEQLYASLPK